MEGNIIRMSHLDVWKSIGMISRLRRGRCYILEGSISLSMFELSSPWDHDCGCDWTKRIHQKQAFPKEGGGQPEILQPYSLKPTLTREYGNLSIQIT